MPSFDVVSKVDLQEVKNAVDQAERHIRTRFDLKDTKCTVSYDEVRITLIANDQMRLQAVQAIVREKLAKRGVSLKSIEFKEPQSASGDSLRQELEIKQGISEEDRKKVNTVIKTSKLKVTSQIQGDQVRVTGKKRDDLQAIIAELKAAPTLSQLELQFVNFRE